MENVIILIFKNVAALIIGFLIPCLCVHIQSYYANIKLGLLITWYNGTMGCYSGVGIYRDARRP